MDKIKINKSKYTEYRDLNRNQLNLISDINVLINTDYKNLSFEEIADVINYVASTYKINRVEPS